MILFSRVRILTLALSVAFVIPGVSANAYSLKKAVKTAVETNPAILEAAASRRATDYELQGAFGAYYPSLTIQGFAGPQYIDRPGSLSAANNRRSRPSRQISVVATQRLFDGFERANEIYRQNARVNSAAARVLERSEIIALDAVEAYIDLWRHRSILWLADENLVRHRELVRKVRSQVEGGSETSSSLNFANERLYIAEAARADVLLALSEVEARFKRVIGSVPGRLKSPPSAGGLPKSKKEAVWTARDNNPAIAAAFADVTASEKAYESSKGETLPKIDLEGRAYAGQDIDGVDGKNNNASLRLVLTWDVFNGGINAARQRELMERRTATEQRLIAERREVDEAAERAFDDVRASHLRIAALRRQIDSARQVRVSYETEFDSGRRSYVDLLDSEASYFNARLQHLSAEAVGKFSGYQLLASMGVLLDYFGVEPPKESLYSEDTNPFSKATTLNIEPLRKW